MFLCVSGDYSSSVLGKKVPGMCEKASFFLQFLISAFCAASSPQFISGFFLYQWGFFVCMSETLFSVSVVCVFFCLSRLSSPWYVMYDYFLYLFDSSFFGTSFISVVCDARHLSTSQIFCAVSKYWKQHKAPSVRITLSCNECSSIQSRD